MAKAQFQKNQRVWVEGVGAWALVERIVPIWAKGFEEPVRITYDVGLGREFHAHELAPEDRAEDPDGGAETPWRLMRARNKWQQPDDCAHHPYPGTYPVVVTDQEDWGGWRVPGAEYDRNPGRIETQARLIVSSTRLLKIARDLDAFVAEAPEDAPAELQNIARRCVAILRYVSDIPATTSGGDKDEAEAESAA
jgi:hypothetical protein